MKHRDFRPAQQWVSVSVVESVQICCELRGFTQSELARLTKIPQSTSSGIETGSINLGIERAKVLAQVL